MKFRRKPLILGSSITGGIAMVAAGARLLRGYMNGLVVGDITSLPPGLMLIVLGGVFFGFGMGHTTAILKIDQLEETQ